MLQFRFQVSGNLLAGVLVALLLRVALTPGVSAIEQKAVPYTTHTGMLAVSVYLQANAAPQITAVQTLPAGRISQAAPGDYSLELLDRKGQSLYALPFQAVFLLPGEPPRLVNELRLVFVLPDAENARQVRLNGPAGSAVWDLEK